MRPSVFSTRVGDDVGHVVVVVLDDAARIGGGRLVCLGGLSTARLTVLSLEPQICGGASVGAHLLVGGIHVHTFPR